MSNAIMIVKKTFEIDKIIESFGNEKKMNQEMAFAIQYMDSNKYLAGIAEKNKASLMKAIMNVALTGISLNPVLKHAYLVPRNKEVCLDFSYRGLSQLAIDAGVVLSINTQIVYEKDFFELIQGSNPQVTHRIGFGDRGNIIGVYSDALLKHDHHQIEQADIADIKRIQRRSPAGSNGPWVSDFNEMVRKTVIKRLFKYLPMPSNIMKAVELSHTLNPIEFQKKEKIDFSGSLS